MDDRDSSDTRRTAPRSDASALDRVLPAVYAEVRRLAMIYLSRERSGHTLQPTALVHEAYLRLAGLHDLQWQSRSHLLALLARVMRSVLVDHARRRGAKKRGGGEPAVTLDAAAVMDGAAQIEFEDLDRALVDLARLNERHAQVVELRFFGGLTIEETAEVLGVSSMTVKRDWALARAWLYRELTGRDSAGA